MTDIVNSSFKKRINKNANPSDTNRFCKGIKTSVYTSKLVVSSGIPSLDNHLGILQKKTNYIIF